MNELEAMRTFMERYVPLNFIEWKLIRSRMRVKTFKAGEIMLYQGDVCTQLLFITKGLARASILTEEGKDLTWLFMYDSPDAHPAHRFAIDFDSLLSQTPSQLTIEAIDPCRCVVYDYDAKHWLYRHSVKFHEFGRKMTEEAYRYAHRYLVEMRTMSVEQRYERFVAEHADIIDRIPQYHIATYIGVTPQYLSKCISHRQSHS